MNAKEFALKQHEEWNGKIEVIRQWLTHQV